MKYQFIFSLSFGIFYDKKKHWLYFFPVPTLGVMLKLPIKKYAVYLRQYSDENGNMIKIKEFDTEVELGVYGSPSQSRYYSIMTIWAENPNK